MRRRSPIPSTWGPLASSVSSGDFSLGSSVWPGVSKLIEECGEVQQVCGKLLGTGGLPNHWDGTDLSERLLEEMADVTAAVRFVLEENSLDEEAFEERIAAKLQLFREWHTEQTKPLDPVLVQFIVETSMASDQIGDELVVKVHNKLWRTDRFTPQIAPHEEGSLAYIRDLSEDDAWRLITKVLKEAGHY